jgi:putative aldouronate transport system permease protein
MSNVRNRIRYTMDENIIHSISIIFITIFMLLCVYPFWNVFINSIATKEEAVRGVYFFPKEPTFKIYKDLLYDGTFLHSVFISVSRTVLSTVGCVVFSSMFAFLITQEDLPHRKLIYRYAIITMYVSGGIIPWYLVMKIYGLYNNFLVYVLPNLLGVYYCILIKTYIESLPQSLLEAARIDGASFFTLFFKVVFPLSKPILATVALYQAVGQWSSYQDNYLLVQRADLQTVQMTLFNYINNAEAVARAMQQAVQSGANIADIAQDNANNATGDSVRNATTVMSMLPIMMVYPFLQKYFAKGIMLGAVKG